MAYGGIPFKTVPHTQMPKHSTEGRLKKSRLTNQPVNLCVQTGERKKKKKKTTCPSGKPPGFLPPPSSLSISEPNDGQRYSLSAGEMRFSSRPNTHGRLLIMLVPPSALLSFSWSGTGLAWPNPNRNHDSNCKTDFESVLRGDIYCVPAMDEYDEPCKTQMCMRPGSGHPLSKIPLFPLLPGGKARSSSWWWVWCCFDIHAAAHPNE